MMLAMNASSLWRAGTLLAMLAACDLSVAADQLAVAPLVATAKRAGLRVLSGNHLALATDRPVRDGDGVSDLPRLFDEAFEAWSKHFGLDPAAHSQWQAFGCLVVDRERFRAAGLLPESIPDFTNGFCDRNRFWMVDQSNPAYRRHLLLHEGVHAFTLTLCSLDTPPWYTEGIAEYLATHRLEVNTDGQGSSFVPTPIPARAADVEQLGRIEILRRLRATGNAPSLTDVLQSPATAHHDLRAYALSWAAVAMLSQHPAFAKVFASAERQPLDQQFALRLTSDPLWNATRATLDFDAFTDDIDYGYDFSRSSIDWSIGEPLRASQRIAVDSTRGWQNSGWSLTEGQQVSFGTTGRYQIGTLPQENLPAMALESEADGISLRWYRGRPLGQLLMAQWIAPQASSRGQPRFVVVATGANGIFKAPTAGVLYGKVNDPPGELADNAGVLDIEIRPAP